MPQIGSTFPKSVQTFWVSYAAVLKEAMVERSCHFGLKSLTVGEVTKLIKGLRNSSATGVDFIDTRILKLGADILAPAVQLIINLSISTSTFPDQWKWHKVIPLLKGSECDRLLPKSYRPVALLPVLSKILEKVSWWSIWKVAA